MRLSICIPCRDRTDPQLLRLLASIKQQTFTDYELLVETRGNSEEAKALSIQQAQGEILAFFCSDNVLRDRRFLEVMVGYASRDDCDGAYTAHYDYMPGDTALNRYFALLGANDPVCWWLGKADRESYLRADCGGISGSLQSAARRVRFNHHLPSLGDNGFFCKAALVKPFVSDPKTFGSTMDLWHDIWQVRGPLTFWIVAEQALWHRTADSWVSYFRKRRRYVDELYWGKLRLRRWQMVSGPRDWLWVLGFVLCSFSVFPMVAVSWRGYRAVRDPAWFLHPCVCTVLTILYGASWLMFHVQHIFRCRKQTEGDNMEPRYGRKKLDAFA